MSEQLIYQLLKIIKHNGNIWELINAGYEFGQATYFIDAIVERGYIFSDSSDRITVTDIGNAFISGFEANNSIRQYSKWILPCSEMWHRPISESYIYVPKG